MTTQLNLQSVRVYAEWNEKTYPAFADLATEWNGFVVPFFSKEVAQEIVNDQAVLVALAHDNEEIDTLAWDDTNTVLVATVGDHTEVVTVHPITTEHGDLYCIGGYNWTWEVIE